MLESIENFISSTGIAKLIQDGGWKNLIMFLIAGVLIYLAIAKQFEPLLLLSLIHIYKTHGKTLCDALEDLFEKYGFYQEKTLDFYFDMPGGQERIAGMMEGLRSNPPSTLAKDPVTVLRDYQAGKIYHKITGEITPTGLPVSDILYFSTDHCDPIIRPSGTEHKLKIYLLACSTDKKTSKNILDAYESAISAVMDI